MIRWQNCVAFNNEQEFMENTRKWNDYFVYSHGYIRQPKSYPCFYVWHDISETWDEVPRETAKKIWNKAIKEYLEFFEELRKI